MGAGEGVVGFVEEGDPRETTRAKESSYICEFFFFAKNKP